MTDAGDSLGWVSEWKLVPWHELNLLAHHVDEILLARCARKATKRLLAEHSILFVLTTTLAHEKTVQVLELALVNLESFLSLGLVSELLRQKLDDVV